MTDAESVMDEGVAEEGEGVQDQASKSQEERAESPGPAARPRANPPRRPRGGTSPSEGSSTASGTDATPPVARKETKKARRGEAPASTDGEDGGREEEPEAPVARGYDEVQPPADAESVPAEKEEAPKEQVPQTKESASASPAECASSADGGPEPAPTPAASDPAPDSPEAADSSTHSDNVAAGKVQNSQDQGTEESCPQEESLDQNRQAKKDQQAKSDGDQINQDTAAGSIQRLFNIGKARDVKTSVEKIVFQAGFEGDRKREEPVDPTKPYPARPVDIPRLTPGDQVETWERELRKRRIIVLGCLHARVLLSATYDLLEGSLLSDIEKRLLDFDLLSGDRQSELALYSLAETKIGGTSRKVVVVNLSSRPFLDSMFRDLSLLLSTQELLAKGNTYLLLLVSDHEILEAFAQKLEECYEVEDDQRYFFSIVPFLQPLLTCYFPKLKAAELTRQVEAQRNAGLWGSADSEVELFQWVRRLLREGPDSLEREVEARACAATGASAFEVRRAIETIDASELFETTDDVGRTVLYAVAKFPGLHPDEFERLMEILLADRIAEVEFTEEEVGEEGTARKVTRKRERDLIDLWGEAPDHYLDDCQVQAVQQEDGSDSVDFVAPYLRRDIVEVLRQRHPLYLRHRLERLLEAGLLFEGNGRPKLRDRTIALAVEMTLADPGRFDERWLTRHVVRLDAVLGDEMTHQEEEGWAEDGFTSDEQMFHSDDVRRRVRTGLSEFLREMLRHDRLKPVVERWLEELLRSRKHRQALPFVLDIVKDFRFAPDFVALHWFRRLLDEAPEEVQTEVYESLLQAGIDLRLRAYDLLEPISEWLPDPEASAPPERPSSRYALQLMADYCYQTLGEFDPETAGAWPSRYPLFGVLRKDSERTEARLRLLISWLLHPAMKWIAGKEMAELLQENLWTFRAAVIEEWYWVLLGHGEKAGQEAPAASDLADNLLQQVLKETSPGDRRNLLGYWRTWRAGYLEQLRASRSDQKEAREQAKRRRTCSLRLERRFKELNLERKRGGS